MRPKDGKRFAICTEISPTPPKSSYAAAGASLGNGADARVLGTSKTPRCWRRSGLFRARSRARARLLSRHRRSNSANSPCMMSSSSIGSARHTSRYDIEEYARFIPLSTLVNMNACDYSTLRARYPAHLSAFDLSQFTAREFVEALGPGMIPRLLAIQREERLARQ